MGLVGLGRLPILVLVADTEANRRIPAGLSQSLVLGAVLLGGQPFWLETLNEQCVLSWGRSKISKEGWNYIVI